MNTVAVILAAGSGTRLGGVAKALLPQADTTFLATIVALARDLGVSSLVVVGGPFEARVAAHAAQLGVPTVRNPDAARGMASSIAVGFAALPAGTDAAWLWPVDHPFVAPATLRALLARFDGDPHRVVRPRYQGRGGHPPLVGAARFPALAACANAPHGARDVLRSEDTIDIEVDDAGVVRDVDTPESLA